MGGPSETTPTTCQRMAPYDTTTPISSLPGDGDGDAAPVSSSDGPMIHKRVTRSSSAVSTEERHSSSNGRKSGSKNGHTNINGNNDSSNKPNMTTSTVTTKTNTCESSSPSKQEKHQQQQQKQQQEDQSRLHSSSSNKDHHPTSRWTCAAYLLLLIISKYTLPDDLRPTNPTLKHVWYYGWVTALSTGLGAAPLMLAHDLGKQMLGVGNAIAAGMMLSASYSLVTEGATVEEPAGMFGEGMGILAAPWARVAVGVLAGLAFILSTKKILDKYEDLKLGDLRGIDAKKVLLIVFVMTLHSFSEGVGIGVSFGGAGGARLGFIISATLAVHNVPEGLAVALVLNPRGVSKLNTGLWCVFTSLPQPLMAVPAFLFVGQFMPFLPVGLGFAAGAMFWVACFELFLEAVEDSSAIAASLTTVASFVTMLCVHSYLDHEL